MNTSESIEPIFVSVPEAGRLLGIGRTKTYELAAAGELPMVRIGKSVRIPVARLRQWAERLEAEQAER